MRQAKFYKSTEYAPATYYDVFSYLHETIEPDITIFAMEESYVFSEDDNLQNIIDLSITSQIKDDFLIELVPSVVKYENFGVASISDLTCIDLEQHAGKKINSFIIANLNEPMFQICNLDDLPFTVTGKDIRVNFSKGVNKLLRYNLEKIIIGSTMISDIVTSNNFYNSNNTVNMRSTKAVTRAELVDKSGLKGKDGIYKDISISGKAHPLTGDLVSLQGNAAVTQSLKNILLANAYERPFSSQQIAGNLHAFLFEFNDELTHSELKTGISIAISNHEPRVTVVDILVSGRPESYAVEVQLIYIIKTTNQTQTFSIMLERA